ncbi:MAG TPA: hypothetical protein DCL41_04705, partial [Bdellovibrionales bacterium]|nr:hypothetical protein [Bdellovibrionales bacterium]
MKIANQTSGKGRNSKFLLWGALGVLGAAVVGCAPAFEAQNPVVKNGSTILDQPFDPKVPTPKLEMDNAGKKSQAALMDEKPFFEGKKTIEVKPYKAPPKAVQKIEEERKYYGQPTSGIHLAEKAQNFELKGFSFTVDLDQKKMRFKGQLNKNGELLEAIDLEGTFNPGATLWSSNDLFPIDEKLRSERRIQATAICLDVNVCEKVAVRFYYLYNGEVLELHFERGAVSVGARPPLKDKIKNPSETEEPLEPPTELGPQEVLSDLGELQEVDAGEENDDVYLDFLSLDHQAVPVQPGQPKAKEGGDDELLPPDQDAEDVEENSGTDFKAALLAPGPTQTPAPKTSSD